MKPIRFPGAPELPPNGNGSRPPNGQDATGDSNRSTGFIPRPGGEVIAPNGQPGGVQGTTQKAVLWGAVALLAFLFFEGRG
jgi:hypothetical protein